MDPFLLNAFLPQLFDLISFAPHLETLSIASYFLRELNPELMDNLKRLDQSIKSHNSMQRVVIGFTLGHGSYILYSMEEGVKHCMPWCVENGMLRFAIRHARFTV